MRKIKKITKWLLTTLLVLTLIISCSPEPQINLGLEDIENITQPPPPVCCNEIIKIFWWDGCPYGNNCFPLPILNGTDIDWNYGYYIIKNSCTGLELTFSIIAPNSSYQWDFPFNKELGDCIRL